MQSALKCLCTHLRVVYLLGDDLGSIAVDQQRLKSPKGRVAMHVLLFAVTIFLFPPWAYSQKT